MSFATESYSCAVVEGAVQCWGANDTGQLGDGLLAVGRPLPVRIPTLSGVTSIAAGGGHACAVAAGELHCWGGNLGGALGSPGGRIAIPPRRVEALPAPVSQVAAGSRHTCAVAAGDPWCWGSNASGELGAVSDERCRVGFLRAPCSATPLRVEGLGRPVVSLALGGHHSCAVVVDAVWCWGDNARGQLGEAPGASHAPRPVSGLPRGVSALAAGFFHSCAVAAGGVYCWGGNEAGQLGDGTTTDRSVATHVKGLPAEATAVGAGHRHSCAIAGGEVYCWGEDAEGQVGSAGRPTLQASRVAGLDGTASAVSAGSDVSCALLEGTRVACWGADDFGQLGRGRRRTSGIQPVGPWDTGRIRDVDGDGRIVVVCLGDSNTESVDAQPESWCERLDRLLGDPAWSTINRSIGGATATRASMRPGERMLDYALAHDSPDVVIAAFGTNDLLADVAPAEVLEAYIAMKLQALAEGVAFFVALTPPGRGADHPINPKVEELNELLRTGFLPGERVDFWSDFTTRDFVDHIHLGPSGQSRRARAALATLRNAGAPDERS